MIKLHLTRFACALGRDAKAWTRHTAANVAMIFALSLLPIIAVVGFAIDNGRHVTYQSKLQTSLDLAALATARSQLKKPQTEEELTLLAQDFFEAQFALSEGVTLTPLKVRKSTGELVLTAEGTLDTTLMNIIGRRTMPLGAVTAVVIDVRKPVELAMVLDTSGSMSGSKIATLKDSAKQVVDMLLPSYVPSENVAAKIAVVPFARYVNVGTDKRYQPWINVEPARSRTRETCSTSTTNAARRAAGCARESYSCTRWRGSREMGNREQYTTTCRRWVCPDGAEPERTETCRTRTTNWRWYGCVASRDNPLNVEDRDYDSDKIKGFLTKNGNLCPAEIQELTNNHRHVDQAIDALRARNDTYIATGLIWGLRTLSSEAPFSEGEDYTAFANADGRKVMILMSDGANTRSPSSNGLHNSRSESVANANTSAVCEEAKGKGVELFAIAFDLDDEDTKDMLEACSSGDGYYYDASNAAELQQAFAEIGSNLRELAIAR